MEEPRPRWAPVKKADDNFDLQVRVRLERFKGRQGPPARISAPVSRNPFFNRLDNIIQRLTFSVYAI